MIAAHLLRLMPRPPHLTTGLALILAACADAGAEGSLAAGDLSGHPNAPGYGNSATLDFTQAVPATTGTGLPRYIVGAQPFLVVYDDGGAGDNGSNWARVTDAAAPESPSSVWESRIRAGVYDTGVPGTGQGRGFGNLNYAFSKGVTKLYFCDHIKYASNFTFNPVSTKYVTFFKGPTNALLFEWLEYKGWLQIVDNYLERAYTSSRNARPAVGQWHRVEIRVELGNPGMVRLWLDGTLLANSTQAVDPNPIREVAWTNHLGGGGSTIPQDTWIRHDNIYLEWE